GAGPGRPEGRTPVAGDQPSGGLRGGGRAVRVGEAGGGGDRRGCGGGCPGPRPPRAAGRGAHGRGRLRPVRSPVAGGAPTRLRGLPVRPLTREDRGLEPRAYLCRAPISWTSSLMPGVMVALMVAPLR